jgi:hypothetical protein
METFFLSCNLTDLFSLVIPVIQKKKTKKQKNKKQKNKKQKTKNRKQKTKTKQNGKTNPGRVKHKCDFTNVIIK